MPTPQSKTQARRFAAQRATPSTDEAVVAYMVDLEDSAYCVIDPDDAQAVDDLTNRPEAIMTPLVSADFARTIERENAELRALLNLADVGKENLRLREEVAELKRQLAEAQSRIYNWNGVLAANIRSARADALEEAAKWHDYQADEWQKHYGPLDPGNGDMHRKSAASIRTLKETP